MTHRDVKERHFSTLKHLETYWNEFSAPSMWNLMVLAASIPATGALKGHHGLDGAGAGARYHHHQCRHHGLLERAPNQHRGHPGACGLHPGGADMWITAWQEVWNIYEYMGYMETQVGGIMWNQVFLWFCMILYVFVVKVLLRHVAGGTFPARPGWRCGRLRRRGGSGAAEWNCVAPGGQVQRAAHVLRQQDGASGGKLGEWGQVAT